MNPGTGPEWKAALDTIHKLRAHGHVAFLAGGCVRDMLLERTPKDYDVATDATPDRLREIFRSVRMVGAKFGVTKERIRQLESRALQKLRKIAHEEKLDIPGI